MQVIFQRLLTVKYNRLANESAGLPKQSGNLLPSAQFTIPLPVAGGVGKETNAKNLWCFAGIICENFDEAGAEAQKQGLNPSSVANLLKCYSAC